MSNVTHRMTRGAVDLDGVVASTYPKLIAEAKRRYGCKLADDHAFCDYDLSVGTDITEEHMVAIFGSEGFYDDLPTVPFAVETLRDLYRRDFQINIITARPNNDHVRQGTLRWLADVQVPLDSLHILTKHNSYVGGADAKAVVAKGLDLGWAVEDSALNAIKYAQVCDVVFLVNTSYNSAAAVPDNVVRIDDLREMATHLREENATV